LRCERRDEIFDGAKKNFWVVPNHSQHVIAAPAQEATDLARRVAMVDMENAFKLIFFWSSADRALATLRQ
jgi:hypothetical protein